MQTWSFCQPQKAEHNHKEGCLWPLDAPGQRALVAAAEGLLTHICIYTYLSILSYTQVINQTLVLIPSCPEH